MTNKSAILVGVVVVIVAVAAVAAFALNNGNDKATGDYTIEAGDSLTWRIFGIEDGQIIEGTVTDEILDVKDDEYQSRYETAIYTVDSDGKKEPHRIKSGTDWYDKSNETLPKIGDVTVDTFWGERTLQYYSDEDFEFHLLYDGDILFAQMYYSDENNVEYWELIEYSAFKNGKVDREIHEAGFDMRFSSTDGSTTSVMDIHAVFDNKETAIFKEVLTTVTVDPGDGTTPTTETGRSWYSPFGDEDSNQMFDMLPDGIRQEGKQKIDTVWGTLEVDVYVATGDGWSGTIYVYEDIPIRYTASGTDGTKVSMEITSMTIDGKDATPDEFAEFFGTEGSSDSGNDGSKDDGSEESDAYTLRIGDRLTYKIVGLDGTDILDGTRIVTVVDMTDDWYELDVVNSIYTVDKYGNKAEFDVGEDTIYSDDVMSGLTVNNGTKTVNTFWGEKTLTYLSSKNMYEQVLVDKGVIYASLYIDVEDNTQMLAELTGYSALEGKEVDRNPHQIAVRLEADGELSGQKYHSVIEYTSDNLETEIFKKMTEVVTASDPDDPSRGEYNSGLLMSWTGPFNITGIETSTETIETKWGSRTVDVAKMGNGVNETWYIYNGVPVKVTVTSSSGVMTYNVVSLTINGKEVDLDEAAF